MLQYQTDKIGKIDKTGYKQLLYISMGFKAGIPVRGKYSNTASLSNTAFYDYENSMYDTQKFLDFGNFPNQQAKGNLNLKTVFFFSVEAGIKWQWKEGEKYSIYTGAFLDYGLNNMVERQSALPSLVEYNADPPSFVVNSILQSQYARDGGAAQMFTEKIRPVAAGIKVRVSFSHIL